jgi:hypothetical protein
MALAFLFSSLKEISSRTLFGGPVMHGLYVDGRGQRLPRAARTFGVFSSSRPLTGSHA